MGLLMFREPESPKSPKNAIRVDPTAHARSVIRRDPAPRTSSSVYQERPGAGRALRDRMEQAARSQHNTDQDTSSSAINLVSANDEGSRARNRGERESYRDYRRRTQPHRLREFEADNARTLENRQRRLLSMLNSRFTANGEVQSGAPASQDSPSFNLSNASGLGDRRRSPSPEESSWETLRESIREDERLPSASSSFASTAALSTASLSRERSMRSSPATSIDGIPPAISFYPPQRNSRDPTIHNSHADDDQYTSLFVCESAPTSDSEDAAPPPDPSTRRASPPVPRSVARARIQRAWENMGENVDEYRTYSGPSLPRRRHGRHASTSRDPRERSPGAWRDVPPVPPTRSGDDHSQSFSARASRNVAAAADIVRERQLNVDELHARYAALQRQEVHLNELIRRLTREEEVPDGLWVQAGVERHGIEHRDRREEEISRDRPAAHELDALADDEIDGIFGAGTSRSLEWREMRERWARSEQEMYPRSLI